MGKGVSTDWLCHHTAEWHLHHHTSCSHPKANEICVEIGVPFFLLCLLFLFPSMSMPFKQCEYSVAPAHLAFYIPFLCFSLSIRRYTCQVILLVFLFSCSSESEVCFALKQCDVSAKTTVSMTVFDFGVCVCRFISDLKTLSKWRQPKH